MGMGEDEARNQAYLDSLSQVVWAGVGGALSGAAMGGGLGGVDLAGRAVQQRQQQTTSRAIDDAYATMQREGLFSPAARQAAGQAQQRIDEADRREARAFNNNYYGQPRLPELRLAQEQNQEQPAAVSYTHLDVYKRQTVVCTSTQVSITGNSVFINGEPQTTSDANRKTEVQYDVENYLSVFDRLKPCTFRYTDGSRRHMGLIAQEVQAVLAEEGIDEKNFAAICTIPQSEEFPDGLNTLRYGEIQIMAIAKIQQLAAEVARLKEQVAALSAGKE